MKEEIIPFDATNITVFSEFESQLAELEDSNEKIQFDYYDAKGNKEARSHVAKLRKTKSGIDRARKTAKQAALDYGRALDGKAKEITARVEAMIDVHAKPLREIEQAEEARVRCHEDNIQAFFAFREFEPSCTSKDYEAELELLEKIPLDDSWEEFRS